MTTPTDDTAASRATSIATYVDALIEPSSTSLQALSDALSPDVHVAGILGPGDGFERVYEAIEHPRRPGFLTGATWSVREGTTDVVDVELPVRSPVARVELHLTFDGGLIKGVAQAIQMAPPAAATPLELTGELAELVNGALANGTPMLLVYVDDRGTPHLSLRGSTSVHGPTSLALWIRDPHGGFLRAIETNPRVALQYRDAATSATFQFTGTAHADDSPGARDAVYARTPALEQNLDALRRGRAVIVELDLIEGAGPGGRVRMSTGT